MPRPTTRRCRTCECARAAQDGVGVDCCSDPDRRRTCLACPCSMSSDDNDKFFTEWEETFDSFDQMGLHENLLRGIYAYGEASTLQHGVGAVQQRPCSRSGPLDAAQHAAVGCNPHTAAAAAVAGFMGPWAAARLAVCMMGQPASLQLHYNPVPSSPTAEQRLIAPAPVLAVRINRF